MSERLSWLVVLAIGCGGGGDDGGDAATGAASGSSGAPTDVQGEWCGSWAFNDLDGRLSLALAQSGAAVTGGGALENTPCGSYAPLSVSATASAAALTGSLSGAGVSLAFEGSVAENGIDGTFQILESPGVICKGKDGTFSATRSDAVASVAGTWTGTTAGGDPVMLAVSDEQTVTLFTIDLSIDVGMGTCSGTFALDGTVPLGCNGLEFEGSLVNPSGKIETLLTITFDGEAATGSYDVNGYTLVCGGNANLGSGGPSGTFTLQRQP